MIAVDKWLDILEQFNIDSDDNAALLMISLYNLRQAIGEVNTLIEVQDILNDFNKFDSQAQSAIH